MISIVLPCYNPVDGWCQTLLDNISELNAKLPDDTIQYIISNDGSTRLDKAQVRILLNLPQVLFLDNTVNEGKGAAIRKGTMSAEGDIIIYTDIDFPFGTDPIVEMVNVFTACFAGYLLSVKPLASGSAGVFSGKILDTVNIAKAPLPATTAGRDRVLPAPREPPCGVAGGFKITNLPATSILLFFQSESSKFMYTTSLKPWLAL